jgi:hypothetical protein
MPANAGIHVFLRRTKGVDGRDVRRAEATPFFERLLPGHVGVVGPAPQFR